MKQICEQENCETLKCVFFTVKLQKLKHSNNSSNIKLTMKVHFILFKMMLITITIISISTDYRFTEE